MIGSEVIHYARYVIGLDRPHTQTTDAERNCLSRHAAGKQRAIEIGVFEGLSTGIIRRAMEAAGVLYAVDPFPAGRLGLSWQYLIARSELRNTVKFVRLTSREAAQTISDTFDFAFVDGDHSLEGIKTDWEAWAPRIALGGIICLHDTRTRPFLGSQQFFESDIRHDRRFEIVEQVDSLSVLRRVTSQPMSSWRHCSKAEV